MFNFPLPNSFPPLYLELVWRAQNGCEKPQVHVGVRDREGCVAVKLGKGQHLVGPPSRRFGNHTRNVTAVVATAHFFNILHYMKEGRHDNFHEVE